MIFSFMKAQWMIRNLNAVIIVLPVYCSDERPEEEQAEKMKKYACTDLYLFQRLG